jgi:hypothetical protein
MSLDQIISVPHPDASEWESDRWNNFDLRGADRWDLQEELGRVRLRLRLETHPHPWLRLREGALLDALGRG